jgi:hypothetical protein
VPSILNVALSIDYALHSASSSCPRAIGVLALGVRLSGGLRPRRTMADQHGFFASICLIGRSPFRSSTSA